MKNKKYSPISIPFGLFLSLFSFSFFLSSLPKLQAADITVFTDNFNLSTGTGYDTSGAIGTSSTWSVSLSGADMGARINSGRLELTNDAGASTNANGWVYGYTSVSGFSSPFNAVLSSNTGQVTWEFNMRQIRSDPSGISTSGNYGSAFVLGSTTTAGIGSGDGYAVVLGGGGGVDPIRLVKFTGGLRGTVTDLGSALSPLNDIGAEYLSLRVTYDPSGNAWKLYGRNDGSSSFTDPTSGTAFTSSLIAASDNSYTGSTLSSLGGFWSASTLANQTAFFDNIYVKVAEAVAGGANAVLNWTGTGSGGTWAAGQNGKFGSSFSSTNDSVVNFAGTGEGVTVSGDVQTGKMNFQVSGYSVSGGNSVTATNITVTNGVSATVDSVLAGANGLRKEGAGTLTLGGANTVTGTIAIAEGKLATSAAERLADGAAVDISSGATLGLGGNESVASVSGAGTVDLGTSTLTYGAGNASSTISGTITNGSGGKLVKTGNGTTTFSGSFATNGTLRVEGGVFDINRAGSSITSALNANNIVELAGGTLRNSASSGASGALTFSSLILAANTTNTYEVFRTTGTAGHSPETTANIVFGNNSTLNLAHAGTATNTVSRLQGSHQLQGNGTIGVAQTSADFQMTGLGESGGSYSLTKKGAGTLSLIGDATYTGGTMVEAGKLSIGRNTTNGSISGNISVSNGAVVQFSRSDASTYAGNLNGAGAFIKTNAGNLTVTGNSTLTGGYTVGGGTLTVNGSMTGSATTVSSGATLGGSGSVGALTVASGGVLSPGNSPGTLSAADVTWAGGAKYVWEINNFLGTEGNNWDFLNATGTLMINATSGSKFLVDIVSLLASNNTAGGAANFDLYSNYSFAIATAAGGISYGDAGAFSADRFLLNTAGFANAMTDANTITAGFWAIGQSGNSLVLNYTAATAIPEPGSGSLLVIGLGMIAALRRRHLFR
jgi:autotransporter-associated beta strand protein